MWWNVTLDAQQIMALYRSNNLSARINFCSGTEYTGVWAANFCEFKYKSAYICDKNYDKKIVLARYSNDV